MTSFTFRMRVLGAVLKFHLDDAGLRVWRARDYDKTRKHLVDIDEEADLVFSCLSRRYKYLDYKDGSAINSYHTIYDTVASHGRLDVSGSKASGNKVVIISPAELISAMEPEYCALNEAVP